MEGGGRMRGEEGGARCDQDSEPLKVALPFEGRLPVLLRGGLMKGLRSCWGVGAEEGGGRN